jgi:hypothetical protein
MVNYNMNKGKVVNRGGSCYFDQTMARLNKITTKKWKLEYLTMIPLGCPLRGKGELFKVSC